MKKFIKILLILFITFIILMVGLYTYAYFLSPIKIESANSYFIYDNKDNLINQGSNNSSWISLNEIDPKYKDYIINVEDKYFYHHFGFDPIRIIKTLFLNFKSGKIVGGASSISQQYVKNLFLQFDQTWERKIKEAFLTIRLETHYSKDEILEGYLNTIYFGQGIYGINDASKYYFNKTANDLTMEEAIILAGIPKSPNNYNPISNINACKERAKVVSNLLLKNNAITKEEYNSLNFDNIKIYGKLNDKTIDILMYYEDAVKEELQSLKNIPSNLINSGGLRIFTNMDMNSMEELNKSINKYSKDDDTQIASILVEPETGKVLAIAGGRNYKKSEYNRVTKSKRQVGSTIKPFLYYTALNNGMTVSSTFKSEETTFTFSNNKTYTPTNYGNMYGNREISMAAALAYSDNIYAVKTHLFLGENELVKTLKKCGLTENLNANPSLALGAHDINMLDYATAYTTLASGGYKKDLYFINRIEDIYGNILYEHKTKPELVLNEDTTYILNETMRNTYNYDFVNYYSPTVLYLNGKMKQKYALKSGTTDNDYWIVGYNKKALMMVWAGNDKNENVTKEYSKIIKNIWLDTIEKYEEYFEDTWYSKPDNIVAVPTDPISGKYNIKSNTLFYYKKGEELAYIN